VYQSLFNDLFGDGAVLSDCNIMTKKAIC